jgi:hypothetical protein
MEPYTADELAGGWTTVTPLLYIGDSPWAFIPAEDDVERAVRCIDECLSVSVNGSETAIAVLVTLGVDPEQAERQVGWANGQI